MWYVNKDSMYIFTTVIRKNNVRTSSLHSRLLSKGKDTEEDTAQLKTCVKQIMQSSESS